jgi:hypothetical protein
MQQNDPVSVLIAPLNWGLGHATRCIPIIKELVNQGSGVIIAAVGNQKKLLEAEFPHLEFIEIPGREMRYKRGFFLKWSLIFSIPGILRQIRDENTWLDNILRDHKIDAVISDNRYGLFHKDCFCVFITHQLYIQSGSKPFRVFDKWIDGRLLKWNYKRISKFSCCWVPDMERGFSLAGILSHPAGKPPVPTEYIGILSRFQYQELTPVKNSLLILLSGPEPQRTRFENILFGELAGVSLETIVVRGLPETGKPVPFIGEGIKIYNHLGSEDLNKLIIQSEWIIARSGYSTVMDLVKLKRTAVLVPTPGQTEQEYLGRYLHEKKWMYSVPQKNFNLEKTLRAFQKIKLEIPEMPDSPLETVVKDFLDKISLQR